MRLGKSENPKDHKVFKEKLSSNLNEIQRNFEMIAQERLQREEFERKFEESKMNVDQLKLDVEKRDAENKKRLRRGGGREDAIGEEID
jgi:hypothetical protein